MLSPLLAVLLSAASDSAIPTDPIAQRAADSAALERVSPLPASPTSYGTVGFQSPRLEDSTGPLAKGSVGLGFRVLGDVPRLHLQVAVSSWNFIRLRGAFSQRSETESRSLAFTPVYSNGFEGSTTSKNIDVEQSSTEWQLQLAMGGLGLCHGSLCGSWSLGPFWGRTISTTENSLVQSTDYEIRERSLEKRLGVAGSLGLVWAFHEGLALTADVGASMAKFSGKRNQVTLHTYSDPDTKSKSESEPDGSELTIEFLGVGLDAWF